MFFLGAVLVAMSGAAQTSSLKITLKLDTKADIGVTLAPLKFNKHFAYSFTVDDGYRSAYATAFPLLNGGKISAALPDEWQNDEGGDGSISEGLFFSDGCGNKQAFKLGLAINSGNIGDAPENRGHLSWPEVGQMYAAGWDLLNHGYHHATKHGTDFHSEVTSNINEVKKQFGISMSQFVVPGGESDPGYEHEYEKWALAEGSFAVASYKGAGPAIGVEKPVDLDHLIYARHFLQSGKDASGFPVAAKALVTLDSIAKQPKPMWYNEFTHGVGNSNLWGLSLFFPEFKYYMTSIAAKYGAKGSDTIWMASFQEVYEYIWLRDHTKVEWRQQGTDVVITLQLPQIPKSFRYRSISLNVETTARFNVVPDGSFEAGSDGNGNHKLINVVIR